MHAAAGRTTISPSFSTFDRSTDMAAQHTPEQAADLVRRLKMPLP
ncbi:hypothetical protein HMPREF9098_1539 [Kingella denitrificans ATCC 33394]|uniref:Uncharacterized protein n=1 Tax=Kingella denitrificans ATCC 33394 TaxID=888741 RepID=F0F0A5_9NEIS|nr:hypothetical protein HMPREF9098_1539 [Kingella denitrificans ATCC 33394]